MAGASTGAIPDYLKKGAGVDGTIASTNLGDEGFHGGSGYVGVMTGSARMLEGIEKIL